MPFQFTLQSLLLSVVVIWSSMAAFGPGGLLVGIWIVCSVGYLRVAESKGRALAVILAATVILFFVLLPAFQHFDSSNRLRCMYTNLQQIALGVEAYHVRHGCFPPAYLSDADGKPAHSWRVLILPYLGEKVLYDKYDFSEPWDGPNNRRLAGLMPRLYVCPGSLSYDAATTSYLAVVGPKTAWPGINSVKEGDIADAADSTILLVEVENSGVHWMQPKDLSFGQACRGVNSGSTPGISSPHVWPKGYFYQDTDGAGVAFVDSNVQFLSEEVSPKTIQAMLTIDGGEIIAPGKLDPKRLNWSRCVALIVLAASTLLLLLRPRR